MSDRLLIVFGTINNQLNLHIITHTFLLQNVIQWQTSSHSMHKHKVIKEVHISA